MNESSKTEQTLTLRDRIGGCVFGGALGDALGYVVEFNTRSAIRRIYGPEGIRDLVIYGEKAVISDDTQMTLFTMEGMVTGAKLRVLGGAGTGVEHYLYLSYLAWLQTQGIRSESRALKNWPSALAKEPGLNACRAPGNTCLSALSSGRMGTPQRPLNNSKGCGGVMRAAPLGFVRDWGSPLVNGAKSAAITHGHPLGWIPAGMLADIVYKILYEARKPLNEVIEASLADTAERFGAYPEIGYFEQLMRKAVELSGTGENDADAIESLGEGWVGEEALAIAVYCCLKYPDDLRKALIAAVNHGGDSDSTGAVAGNILGAYLGMKAVPQDWLEKLEMVDVMQKQIDGVMSIATGEWEEAVHRGFQKGKAER